MLGKIAVGEIAVGEVETGEIVLGKLRWGNDLTSLYIYFYCLELSSKVASKKCLFQTCIGSYFIK